MNQTNWIKLNLKESSNIKEAYYNPVEKILKIIFKNNTVYHYFDIETNVIEEWLKAESVGQFFAQKIKWGKYKKVDKE